MAEHERSIGATSEWFTPREIFRALGLVFDLDPCSPGPGHWVPARKAYTQADDGLRQPWHGLVFMNPPFGGRRGRPLVAEVLRPGFVSSSIAPAAGNQNDTPITPTSAH